MPKKKKSSKRKPLSNYAKKSAKTTKKTARVLALAKARKIANAGRTKPPVGTELGGVPGIGAYRNLRKKAKKAAKRRKKTR